MKRIKSLGQYQKGVLLVVTVMVLVFSVIYPMVIARKGFAYKGAILVPAQENSNTIYSGNIQGQQARFTVDADKTVAFQYGEKTYGPYTVREDPTAIPEHEADEDMTGIELRHGEDILFRGGVLNLGDFRWLYNEDGSVENIRISAITGDGIELDENGRVIDPMEPSAAAILDLIVGPELTHRGEWPAWFAGLFLCLFTAMSILFADELFRWNLSFQIRNADQAEPSDWEIAGRYIAWTVLPVAAMVIFIVGLR
ncbi:MAG: hypothetical protein ACOX63_11535 [Christensenellales bacterium]